MLIERIGITEQSRAEVSPPEDERETMYTTDKEYEAAQRASAQEAINSIGQSYTSQKRRIQELERRRTIYMGCGKWQAAIDLLEDQMIAWGREIHHENAALCQHYHEEMLKHSRDSTGLSLELKEKWDEADICTFGLSRACIEARYALRFSTVLYAVAYLEQKRQECEQQ